MLTSLLRVSSRSCSLLDVPAEERQVEDERQPVSVDKEQEGQETVNSDFRDDICVEAVAEVNRVDVVTGKRKSASGMRRKAGSGGPNRPYHSKSLYMMVKKTWRKRLTAFMSTAKRYNHASPDILTSWDRGLGAVIRLGPEVYADRVSRLKDRCLKSEAKDQRLRTTCVLDKFEMRVWQVGDE